MRNRCPTHPGAILREDVLPQLTGMSVSAFARNLGISRQTLHAVLAERSGVEIVIASPQGVAIHDPGLHGLPRFARNDEEKQSQ